MSDLQQIVGKLNQISIALMVVTNRRKEIGLKKVLGAANENIVREFLGKSCLLGEFGGLLSLAAMILLKHMGNFSVIGTFRNVEQILVATFFMDSQKIFLYLLVLGTCGIFIGAAIGLISAIILRRLKRINPSAK